MSFYTQSHNFNSEKSSHYDFPLSSEDSSTTMQIVDLQKLVSQLYREQHKIQDLLSSLGFALRSFNNLNQFLELVPLMTSRVTDADGGALVLFKPNSQVRLDRIHCQDGHTCIDIRKAIEMAINTVSNISKNTKHFSPSLLDEKVKEYLGENIKLLATPILVKKSERGRLYIFSRDSKYDWTETKQTLVRLIADQTAVAIANDELTVELRKKERLDRELEIGAEIQLQLLPREYPQIQGAELAAKCLTASRVGGDYYDFIPANYDQINNNDQGKWSIVIGDVMGKGVPAGLIMTMTRGMLRAEVLNGHSPARILQHLNRVMYADLENSSRFVTLFYSEYDPQTRILSYSNAAHNPPLLWQKATNTMIRLDTIGMLVGLDADSEYEDAQIQLALGDTIIYYTDGFTDAANQNSDRYDEDNLIKAFIMACQQFDSSQAIVDYLFEQVEQFIGVGNAHGDDMTLVVMRVIPVISNQ